MLNRNDIKAITILEVFGGKEENRTLAFITPYKYLSVEIPFFHVVVFLFFVFCFSFSMYAADMNTLPHALVRC